MRAVSPVMPELLLARFLSLDEAQQDIAWRWVKALSERTAPARSARTEVADRRAVASICQHHGDRPLNSRRRSFCSGVIVRP